MTQMQRRHFELIADVLAARKTAREDGAGNSAENVRCDIARAMADALAATNPNFDRGKFLRACVVE